MKIQLVILIASFLGLDGIVHPGLSAEKLIPDSPGKAPDYFCTWNIQCYTVSYAHTSA